MEKKINVAKLLKDCPSGMPLDCAMWDNLYFDRVEDDLIYCYYTLDGYRNITMFVKDGCYTAHKLSKCVIFPKGKTTWEGFVPPCKFKDGDIITNGVYIAIFHKIDIPYAHFGKDVLCYHCWYNPKISEFRAEIVYGIGLIKEYKLATEEEKRELFNAIENNGYHWNAENRTLEKLSEPRFKVGNKIKSKTLDIVNPIEIASVTPRIYTFTDGSFQRVEIIDKDYELINEPRFKVGNRVKSKINQYKYKIVDIRKDVYIMNHTPYNFDYHVPFCNEDNFELIPDKYDINTLKPFDKVLVRDGNDEAWVNAFFGFCDPETYKKCIFVTGNENWCQCIPYEGNEHLLGKTDDCDEYFKNW